MSATRRYNGQKPMPLSYGEISDWSRAFGVSLDPWEQKLIRGLDNTFLMVRLRQQQIASGKPEGQPQIQPDPMDPKNLPVFNRMALLEMQGKRE
jgi:hypothetical protein